MTFAAKRVRPAEPRDHREFVRLFPELAVDDPVKDAGRFEAEIMPGALMAEAEDGRVVGYTYFQIIDDLAYVRHLVSAPEARRVGVATALMRSVADLARAAGCSTWCLNVKPDNVAAISFYESLGLAATYRTKAVRIAWSTVDAKLQMHDARVLPRRIEPKDDDEVERATRLVKGQLASARKLEGRILLALHEPLDDGTMGNIVGAAVFHPEFPGAYPFRVTRPELSFKLLAALGPYARPQDEIVNVVVEDSPLVADALIAAGATVRLESIHMKGQLPPAESP